MRPYWKKNYLYWWKKNKLYCLVSNDFINNWSEQHRRFRKNQLHSKIIYIVRVSMVQNRVLHSFIFLSIFLIRVIKHSSPKSFWTCDYNSVFDFFWLQSNVLEANEILNWADGKDKVPNGKSITAFRRNCTNILISLKMNSYNLSDSISRNIYYLY